MSATAALRLPGPVVGQGTAGFWGLGAEGVLGSRGLGLGVRGFRGLEV